jgi:uncharacterized phiE125 gp8 family phage protein
MEYREKAGQTLTEPVTVAEMKTYMGLLNNEDSDDILLGDMITAARKYLEGYTATSFLSKSYEVRFYDEDSVNNYYLLPFAPVVSITSLEVSGTASDYYQKGLELIWVKPYSSILTVSTADRGYLDVEFIAGREEEMANNAIKRLVNDMWNNRSDNLPDSPAASLSWQTLKYIETLNNNVGL